MSGEEQCRRPDSPGGSLPTFSAPFWSRPQWDVLLALIEAVYPSIATHKTMIDSQTQVAVPGNRLEGGYDLVRASSSTAGAPTWEEFCNFMQHCPARTKPCVRDLIETMARLPSAQRRSLGLLFLLLSTRFGSFALTGHFEPFHTLSAQARESVLTSWRGSWLSSLRVVAKTASTLATWVIVRTDPMFIRLSGYPDTPSPNPEPGYPFSFLQFPATPDGADEPLTIVTDVVIVGSGCGGAVCAKVLAEKGHSVVVLEKSRHVPPEGFPMTQEAGTQSLFEGGGFVATDNPGVNLLAGSTWGGGGTVNWGVSLRTQDFVRREWAEKDKLPLFTSREYEDCMDRVCAFMGVSAEGIRHNLRNRALLEGCRKLGWDARPTPVNSAGRHHHCGKCQLGCPSSGKRGPTVSWLPAAAAAGAEFIEGFQVDRVLFDQQKGKDRIAVGVEGVWTAAGDHGENAEAAPRCNSRRIIVEAKRVILASGALWSPIILANSGLENPNIGANLHIHPCNFVGAFYDEETEPWEGGIITACGYSFENLDNAGHGVKLEATSMVPYSVLSNLPRRGGLEAKLDILRYRHMAAFIALTRDRDPGRVLRDRHSGRPRVAYTPSEFDRAHTLQGVLALAKICHVTGAREIRVFLPGVEPFVRGRREKSTSQDDVVADHPEATDPAFATWLDSVRRVGNKSPVGTWASAHQMGTCRMTGRGGRFGVVDGRGRVFGTQGLLVADASVLPSASGVNPMVTIMAVADWVARGVDEDLKAALVGGRA